MTNARVSRRELGVVGAVGIGLGSMLGAGVFAVWAPAARAAGSWLVAAVVLAALVATINALSTAQLAAAHPVAGGAYTYGSRELPGPWGFVAGIGFVLGKTASVAAMAMTIGAYVWPDQPRLAASLAIACAWAINARGVTRTALATTLIAAVVILGLAAVVGASLAYDAAHTSAVRPEGGVWGVAEAAALVFFAFAGYARLATLGEDVRDPRRVIPRAIGLAVALVVVIYVALGATLLRRPGADALAASSAPLVDAAPPGRGWSVALAALAALAAGGAMVALLAGLGRTAMAMARASDLPRFAATASARGVPTVAEALAGGAAIVLVWVADLGFALAMSSAAVLAYYAVANASAFAARRRGGGLAVPRAVSGAGVVLCGALAASLDLAALACSLGVGVLAVGARAASRAEWRRRGTR